MSHTPDPTTCGQQPTYHIRIRGHLDSRWDAWFDHMTVTPEASGDTLLAGPIIDQAALHGVLRKVRDLGLPLLSIMRVETEPDELDTNHRKDPE